MSWFRYCSSTGNGQVHEDIKFVNAVIVSLQVKRLPWFSGYSSTESGKVQWRHEYSGRGKALNEEEEEEEEYQRFVKCKQPSPGFELESLCLFPSWVTITLQASLSPSSPHSLSPSHHIYIYIYIYIYMCVCVCVCVYVLVDNTELYLNTINQYLIWFLQLATVTMVHESFGSEQKKLV